MFQAPRALSARFPHGCNAAWFLLHYSPGDSADPSRRVITYSMPRLIMYRYCETVYEDWYYRPAKGGQNLVV
jgi:hypothetical protein